MEGLGQVKDLQDFINDDDWGDSDDATTAEPETPKPSTIPQAKKNASADKPQAEKAQKRARKSAKEKPCAECGTVGPIEARDMCRKCYQSWRYHERKKKQSGAYLSTKRADVNHTAHADNKRAPVKQVKNNYLRRVCIDFEERDAAILNKLEEGASENRRTVKMELLHLPEMVLL
jgi:hypothetical protein